jgi:hypothetical protein
MKKTSPPLTYAMPLGCKHTYLVLESAGDSILEEGKTYVRKAPELGAGSLNHTRKF